MSAREPAPWAVRPLDHEKPSKGGCLVKLLTTSAAAAVAAAVTVGLASAAVAAAPGRPVTPQVATPSAVKPAKPGDFNGDGYRDLAIGAPNAKVGKAAKAGAVAVAYGSKKGLSTARR